MSREPVSWPEALKLRRKENKSIHDEERIKSLSEVVGIGSWEKKILQEGLSLDF